MGDNDDDDDDDNDEEEQIIPSDLVTVAFPAANSADADANTLSNANTSSTISFSEIS